MVDLEELKRLLEEATPGPWIEHCASGIYTHLKTENGQYVAEPLGKRFAFRQRNDATLIAALRNAAPALIEELEALREMAAATYSHRDGRDLLAEMRPHTWHFCDIRVRMTGQWKEYEGDWLKRVWMARSRVEAIRAKEGR